MHFMCFCMHIRILNFPSSDALSGFLMGYNLYPKIYHFYSIRQWAELKCYNPNLTQES